MHVVIFKETRRIVSAEIQHITYNEFLPNVSKDENLVFSNLTSGSVQVLGKDGMSRHSLDHEVCVYDDTADPSILNSFAVSAYRFGHSLVQSIFR